MVNHNGIMAIKSGEPSYDVKDGHNATDVFFSTPAKLWDTPKDDNVLEGLRTPRLLS